MSGVSKVTRNSQRRRGMVWRVFPYIVSLLLTGCQAIQGVLTGSSAEEHPTLTSVCETPDCEKHAGGHFSFKRQSGARQAILFIHGFRSSANAGFSLWPEQYFRDHELKDFDVWVFNYPSGLTCPKSFETIDLVASELARFILEQFVNARGIRYEEFHIIAHSLGGVITRTAILSLLKQGKSGFFGLQTLHLADSPNQGIYLTRLIGEILKCQAWDVETATGKKVLQRLSSDWTKHVFRQRRDLPPEQQKDIETYIYVPEDSNFVSRESAEASFDEIIPPIKGTDHWSLVKVDREHRPRIYDEVKGKILWDSGYERPTGPVIWIADFCHDQDRGTTAGIREEITDAMDAGNLSSEIKIIPLKRGLCSEKFEIQRAFALRIARKYRPALVVWGERLKGLEDRLSINFIIETAETQVWTPKIEIETPYRARVTFGPESPMVLSLINRRKEEIPKHMGAFARVVIASDMNKKGRYRNAYALLKNVEFPPETSAIDRLRVELLRLGTMSGATSKLEAGSSNCVHAFHEETIELVDKILKETRTVSPENRAVIAWLKFYKAEAEFGLLDRKATRERKIAMEGLEGKFRELEMDFRAFADERGELVAMLMLGDSLPLRERAAEAVELWNRVMNSTRDPSVKWIVYVHLSVAQSYIQGERVAALTGLRQYATDLIRARQFNYAIPVLHSVARRLYELKEFPEALAVLETPEVFEWINQNPLERDRGNYLILASHLAVVLDRVDDREKQWLEKAKVSGCPSEEPSRTRRTEALMAFVSRPEGAPLHVQAEATAKALVALDIGTSELEEPDYGEWMLALKFLERSRRLLAAGAPAPGDECSFSRLLQVSRDTTGRAVKIVQEPDLKSMFETLDKDFQGIVAYKC